MFGYSHIIYSEKNRVGLNSPFESYARSKLNARKVTHISSHSLNEIFRTRSVSDSKCVTVKRFLMKVHPC